MFEECDSRWTVLLPQYKTSKERDQALGVKRVQSAEHLQEVFLGIIFAPIVIAGTAEIAPMAVAAMPSFSLWGGGSATTSVLGGGGGVLATKTVEYLASPRGQQVVQASTQLAATVSRSQSVLSHIIRDAPGHVNPPTAASQARWLDLFLKVSNNIANVNPSVLTNCQRQAQGFQGFSQTFRNRSQVWVQVLNGEIINAGVNLIPK